MCQEDLGMLAHLPEIDGAEGLDPVHPRALPGPGVDQALRGAHLAIGAKHRKDVPHVGPGLDSKTTADPQVDLGVDHCEARSRPPAFELGRIGPRPKHLAAVRRNRSLQRDRPGRGTAGGHRWLSVRFARERRSDWRYSSSPTSWASQAEA